MAKKLAEPQLVKVTWRDIFGDTTGWSTLSKWVNERTPIIPVTVGFSLPEILPGYTSIAGSYYHEDGDFVYTDIHHFPPGVIVTIEKL